MEKLKIKILDPENNQDIKLPCYMTKGSSGMDISAAVTKPEIINPGEIKMIPTALAMAIPQGYEVQIRPRSGLAIKKGITIVNSPGTIDSDYRGEVKIGLINLGREAFTIERGSRIAQMVIQKVEQMEVVPVDSMDETDRNQGGFGHTGV